MYELIATIQTFDISVLNSVKPVTEEVLATGIYSLSVCKASLEGAASQLANGDYTVLATMSEGTVLEHVSKLGKIILECR